MNRFILMIFTLLWIFNLTGQVLFSQSHVSKNNYTGNWETPASWEPIWTAPQTTNIAGMDIIINGYITVNGSLTFSGSLSNLIINDTLVIKGDLLLGTSSNLTVNGNGILIIKGNLTLDGNPNVITNNYIVISGYIWKLGSNSIGSFVSNSNPTKVFVGAYVYPTALTNKPNFPSLNCQSPTTIPYLHSKCSYGDMTDLINDPIYTFVQSICIIATPTITSGGPTAFCAGGNVTLTSSAGTSYLWSNGATTPSTNVTAAGSYTVRVTNASGCQSVASVATVVTVNTLPATPTITAGGPTTFCAGGSVTLASSVEANYLWSTGATTQSINATLSRSYTVKVSNASGCQSAASVATIVTVNALPVTPTITAGGPTAFCTGGSVTLTSSAGTNYLWSTGASAQAINASITGNYTVQVTDGMGCRSAVSPATELKVNPVPSVRITSSSNPLCLTDNLTLTGNPTGGTFNVISGPGIISGNLLTTTGAGNIIIKYSYTDICTNTDIQSLLVNERLSANAGPDQELKFVFETQMKAELYSLIKGEWTLISGSGQILNNDSPTSRVTGLSVGDNIFLWTVRNGSCEESDEVKITVEDLFVPSVITPDGDGKNDYFQINALIGNVELIIFNRWGNEEYTNRNYLNDWDGRNNEGKELPGDTYFYILKFSNFKTIKGSVLIKR